MSVTLVAGVWCSEGFFEVAGGAGLLAELGGLSLRELGLCFVFRQFHILGCGYQGLIISIPRVKGPRIDRISLLKIK